MIEDETRAATYGKKILYDATSPRTLSFQTLVVETLHVFRTNVQTQRHLLYLSMHGIFRQIIHLNIYRNDSPAISN